VVRVPRADHARRRRRTTWPSRNPRRAPVAADGLATDPHSGAGQPLRDRRAAADLKVVQELDEPPDDIVVAPYGRSRPEQRADRLDIRFRQRLPLPPGDGLRVDEEKLCCLLQREAVRPPQDDDPKSLLGV
jgi:hypothetical protein